MSKFVTIPMLVSLCVEIDDESLSEEDLVDLAIKAGSNASVTTKDDDVTKDCGEGVYVSVEEWDCYEKIVQGNFFLGHISEATVEEGW